MISGIFAETKTNIKELNERCENTMASYLGIQFTEIHSDYLKATMPVNERTVQPLRMLNGGASFALAENLGSMAANLVLDRQKFVALGLDMNGNHLKSALEGETVEGFAMALHIGKSTQVWSIQIKNQLGQLLFDGRLTMAVKSLNSNG
jgi:1,4-dihydroxy-2-naphthoyl-CoA hydrolase